MSCNCSCSYNNLPCCCPQDGETYPCPTTICPDAQKCDIVIDDECIIYNGDDYDCAGIKKGMNVKEIIDIILDDLDLRCTTTTTSTTTTTTSTTSTSTTTSTSSTTSTSTTTSTTSTTTTTTLSPGTDPCFSFAIPVDCKCNYTTYSTSGVTSNIPAPVCPNGGGYVGNDIWFTFIVPATGDVLVSTKANQITDGALAIYQGVDCKSLTQITCVDDVAGFRMPYVYLSGLTPGDTVYVRFWGYGGSQSGQVGTFDICVYEPLISSTCTPSPTGAASACPTTSTTTTTTIDPCSNGGGEADNCNFGPINPSLQTTTTTTTLAPIATSTTTSTSTSTTSTTLEPGTTTTTTTEPLDCPLCEEYAIDVNTPTITVEYTPCGEDTPTSEVITDPGGFRQAQVCIKKGTPIPVITAGDGFVYPDPFRCCLPPLPPGYTSCAQTGLLLINQAGTTTLDYSYDDSGGIVSLLPCTGLNDGSLFNNQSKGWYFSFEVSSITLSGTVLPGQNLYYVIYVDGVYDSFGGFGSGTGGTVQATINGIPAWSFKLITIVVYKG